MYKINTLLSNFNTARRWIDREAYRHERHYKQSKIKLLQVRTDKSKLSTYIGWLESEPSFWQNHLKRSENSVNCTTVALGTRLVALCLTYCVIVPTLFLQTTMPRPKGAILYMCPLVYWLCNLHRTARIACEQWLGKRREVLRADNCAAIVDSECFHCTYTWQLRAARTMRKWLRTFWSMLTESCRSICGRFGSNAFEVRTGPEFGTELADEETRRGINSYFTKFRNIIRWV